MDRREFLKTAAAATVVTSLSDKGALGADSFPYRTLGRSGEKVSTVGLGGYHIGHPEDEQLSIRLVRTALDDGMNFLDNCWDYNGGQSEIRMGKALRDGYRQKAFLMTKIDGQTRQAATQQLEESLRRLQTDHVDLLQFHEVIRGTDPGRIMGAGGGWRQCSRRKNKARFVTLVLPGTRVPTFISRCWKPRSRTSSPSTRCKCRSTSWTLTTTVLKRKFCRCW